MNKKSSGRRSRRSHIPAFKAKVALAALREDKTMATYERQVRNRFTMTAADEDAYGKEVTKRWRSQFAEAIGYLVAGLAIFAASVWSIGWIVRGFLGIPRGMDRRPDL